MALPLHDCPVALQYHHVLLRRRSVLWLPLIVPGINLPESFFDAFDTQRLCRKPL